MKNATFEPHIYTQFNELKNNLMNRLRAFGDNVVAHRDAQQTQATSQVAVEEQEEMVDVTTSQTAVETSTTANPVMAWWQNRTKYDGFWTPMRLIAALVITLLFVYVTVLANVAINSHENPIDPQTLQRTH
jgi:hypothetical protein